MSDGLLGTPLHLALPADLLSQANPIERAFGDVHDKCTRNHQRTRIEELVGDVEQHLSTNGPWQYKLAQLYYAPDVTIAVTRIAKEPQLLQAA
jgi:hypothetical protein